jgi:hypothetical protein
VAFTSVTTERRIGQRWPSTGLAVGWDVHKRSGLRGRRYVARDGIVLDVSVSGAAIIAPVDVEMTQGRVVAVAHGPHIGNVMIRRVMATDRHEQVIYGVEFIDAPISLVSTLVERAADGPNAHPYEGLWALSD